MVYRAIGLMSGSSLDGLDIAFAEFHEQAGQWNYEIIHADCLPYPPDLVLRLKDAIHLSALDYQLLHISFGHYIGKEVNRFIEENKLQYKVALVSSHGHTTFHVPDQKMTGQLGDGASIAATTRLPVVTDLRAMDMALGGQGAPIVPIGEKWLLGDYEFFLNLGGIANLSRKDPLKHMAYDVCPANRVLNMLVSALGKEYDDEGKLAAEGKLNEPLLKKLNALPYYKEPFPKSLANDFGTDIVYPIVAEAGLDTRDSLRTYLEHIVVQVTNASSAWANSSPMKLLATGGGALNTFMVKRLREELKKINIEVIVPDKKLVNFKEALIMAFMGVLRWRQEYNVLSSVTGAERDSIGGALWAGE